ncbi:hypothetical protein [Vibrio coralliirubri]|uniref:hypothetical protein n=1 Tax=Vibrio coralliirubri TaxID=1516159 RepID=UPI00067E8CD0|nr:hypothetical protein [Vibrio coralliirubri]
MIIKVKPSDSPMSPTHDKLVFVDESSARKLDMLNSVGRYNSADNTVFFIDTPEANRYRVLSEHGFQLHISPSIKGNYYISVIQDVINDSIAESVDEAEATINEEYINESLDDEIYNQNSLYLSGTKIGKFNSEGYSLCDDIDEYIPKDLRLSYDDKGQVDVKRMSYKDQVILQKAIHFSKDRMNESELEPESVNFEALASVKKGMSIIDTELRNGNVKDAEKIIGELRLEAKKYKQATPPATGIDAVEQKLDEYEKNISKKKNVSTIEEQAASILGLVVPVGARLDLVNESMKELR